jgi:thiamine-monophosphate kinase
VGFEPTTCGSSGRSYESAAQPAKLPGHFKRYLRQPTAQGPMAGDLLGRLGEAEIIKMLADAFGIGDLDDASPADEDCGIYLSSDMMFQSTDLPTNTHPMFWGFRFVAANASDMSAMGCRPVSMMLSLGLPPEMKVNDFRDLLEGIKWACREGGFGVVGGDTNRAPEVVLSGFITGIPYKRPLRRSGARVGDGIYVTGNPGSAALGLAIIESRPDEYFDSPDVLEEKLEGSAAPIGDFLVPEMRVEEAKEIACGELATACIDISDGIATDANHVALRSGVGMLIDTERLPFSPLSRGIAKAMKLDPSRLALEGGDDYELLFTAPVEARERLAEAEIATLVGEVVEGQGVSLRHPSGEVESLKSHGYQHFPGKGK